MSISKSVLAKLDAALIEYRNAIKKTAKPGPEWFALVEYAQDSIPPITAACARKRIRDLERAGKLERRICGRAAFYRVKP